jgi:UPF0755 protein
MIANLRTRVAALGCAAAIAACGGGGDSATTQVVIPPGATMRVAADSLSRAGIIRAPRLFRMYASLRGRDRRIKAGTYVLRRGSGWGTALAALADGKGLVHIIVIPEGFSLAQIVPVVATKLGTPPESVWAAARDTALRRQLDIPTETLEGYLFPDTYTFPPGTSARDVVRVMVRRFEQIWQPGWTARLDSVHLTRHDILSLASIVEREARLPQERPVIAAVYMNRLQARMLLQADPTVQYALPQHQTRLLYKHLEIESPYNTYKHAGLPPGPIGPRSIRRRCRSCISSRSRMGITNSDEIWRVMRWREPKPDARGIDLRRGVLIRAPARDVGRDE